MTFDRLIREVRALEGADRERFFEQLFGTFSVFEVLRLVRHLEGEWGVQASPSLQLPEPDDPDEPDEPVSFGVKLVAVGPRRIAVIQSLRSLVPGLGLREARDLVEQAPVVVLEGLSAEEAEEAKAKLVAAGGEVEVAPS